ncbi:MAG: glycosyltransferase [Burkholderiales bacterium]|jgi:GT2 family glycosyltransferase/glycosyltransferase involved in cell wall biosynthesis|nr:glycosyltransferase [Burkholderiales bacterium]
MFFRHFRISTSPVDVVVPVYNAAVDVAQCVTSVLRHTEGNYRLIIINDGSTDPKTTAWLAELQERNLPHVIIEHNERNLGFTATANRGMQMSGNDVVLLNSDTIVSKDWLTALRRCAASDARIGTITPFSNNAEICSYPKFCANNPWRENADLEPVRAALAKAAVPSYPEIPTGVGFCLYIKRAVIKKIGVFDMAFGTGYGEENDFCLRAQKEGFTNVLCDDAFVVHTGERSFVGRKTELSERNMPLLLEKHPEYLSLVRQYVIRDPLSAIREAALLEEDKVRQPSRGVLHIIHSHGGGTETYARELIAELQKDWRHYLAIACGDEWQIELHAQQKQRNASVLRVRRRARESWETFLGQLCATLGITLIHVHNISECREGILPALPKLGIPYGYTVHDLSFACPTITFLDPTTRYCGGQTDNETCAECLKQKPDFAEVNIEHWRERHRVWMAQATFVIAPSHWTSEMFKRYFPETEIAVIAHGTSDETRPPKGLPVILMPQDDVPTVAVLGAVGPDKGARRLEKLVALARAQNARIRFVLIGYLDKEHGPWQSEDARFFITGRYDPRDLSTLLDYYRISLVLFPSAGPETFSYTLSETWRAGRPAFVPPIGTLAERMTAHSAGWIMSEEEWKDEAQMFRRLLFLVSNEAESARAEKTKLAARAPQMSLPIMAAQTEEIYRKVLDTQILSLKGLPFPPARIRDALGYQAWSATPPRPNVGLAMRLTQWGVRAKRTSMGHLLYRLTPKPLINALLNRAMGE